MKITVNKSYRCFKAGDVIDLSQISKLQFLTLVGNNGSGKSTLIQTIRGFKNSQKTNSLFEDDYVKLASNVTIESEYEKVFIYDSIKDDPNHFQNAYDAVNFVTGGGMAVKDKSHGESSLIGIAGFVSKIEPKIIKDKTLVILDEIDKGLSLSSQVKFINFIYKLISMHCHVIVITHNVFTINQSMIVFDLEAKRIASAKDYIAKMTGYNVQRIKEETKPSESASV